MKIICGQIKLFCFISLIAAISFTQCGKAEVDPVEIPTIDLDTYGRTPSYPDCGNFSYGTWDYSDYDYYAAGDYLRAFYIIHSESDLDKYSIGFRELFTDIDFTNNTLLLIDGGSPTIAGTINNRLVLSGDNEYTLYVDVIQTGQTEECIWRTATIAPVIPTEAKVNIDLTVRY